MTDVVVNKIIDLYTTRTKGLFGVTAGGTLRSTKGSMVESITQMMVKAAWENLGGDASRLSFQKQKIRIPIKANTIATLPKAVQEEVAQYSQSFYYDVGVDVHVHVDNEFVLGIECKTYAENAMLKRILVDFWLIKTLYPDLQCCLLQLETFLGGSNTSPDPDVSKIANRSTYTLMSHFPTVNMKILTLLEGKRDIKNPIHTKRGHKELRAEYVHSAIQQLQSLLAKFV